MALEAKKAAMHAAVRAFFHRDRIGTVSPWSFHSGYLTGAWRRGKPLGRLSSELMDNLCHSLVGAALAEAGLKKRTALATATLVIGANLPDVDVFAHFVGSDFALGFRRGWTHGILALVLWPFILTGIMLGWD